MKKFYVSWRDSVYYRAVIEAQDREDAEKKAKTLDRAKAKQYDTGYTLLYAGPSETLDTTLTGQKLSRILGSLKGPVNMEVDKVGKDSFHVVFEGPVSLIASFRGLL